VRRVERPGVGGDARGRRGGRRLTMAPPTPPRRLSLRLRAAALACALALTACGADEGGAPPPPPATEAPPAAAPAEPPPRDDDRPPAFSPRSGPPGTEVTVTMDGLPASAQV